MNNPVLEELFAIISSQREIFDELAVLNDRQLEAVSGNDLEELNLVTSLQEEQGRSLAVLEREKRSWMDNFSSFAGREVNSISEIMEYFSEEEGLSLRNLAGETGKSYSDLKKKMELNAMLIKQNLVYANRMLEVIQGKSASGYNNRGRMSPAEGRSFFSRQV